MTATTPNKGIPYAQPADARGAGANAMRDLALKVDELLTAMDPLYKSAVSPDAQTATPNNAWTNVTYTLADDGALAYDGTNVSYSDAPRWFLVSFGANVAVAGSNPSAGLRLLASGQVVQELYANRAYGALGAAVPFRLGAGTGYETLTVQVRTTDGSGSAGGGYDRAFLRVAALG